ncbi:MAG TPA: hypothetical protein VFX51_25360 [Solirubrobacteraceae bacterium]|nr:hypothetical protein [Solirubrobacteraceae bacterium]
MRLVKIEFVNDGEHVVYKGPQGPLRFRLDQSPETAALEEGDRLEFGMARQDLGTLDGGVAAWIAGEVYVLRRNGRSLVLEDGAGRPRAIARRARFGRMRLERPDGTEIAAVHGLDGKVAESADAVEVRLMLLLTIAGAARAIERRSVGDLLPFS